MKQQRRITTINVEGIPQPIARGIEAVVQMLRQQVRAKPKGRAKLPIRHGTVTGPLHRRDVYDDVV